MSCQLSGSDPLRSFNQASGKNIVDMSMNSNNLADVAQLHGRSDIAAIGILTHLLTFCERMREGDINARERRELWDDP
jgi:hypothetical protein